MATKKKTTKKASKKANKSQFINLRVKLPFAVQVGDYHEFENIDETLKKINPKLRCEEIDGNLDIEYENPYWGIVYHGKHPSKETVLKLIKDAGAILVDEEETEE